MKVTESENIKLVFKDTVFMDTGGYDAGYSEGYSDGNTAGYNTGKTEGYTEGYEVGNTEGYNTGKTEGYSEGYEAGNDAGYDTGRAEGIEYGKANAPTEEKTLDISDKGTYEVQRSNDKYISKVTVNANYDKILPFEEKTLDISDKGTYEVIKTDGNALSKVIVNANYDKILPFEERTLDITDKGSYEVERTDGYAISKVTVNANYDKVLPTQEKSVTITENGSTEVVPDDGYALSKVGVTVNVSSGGDDELVKITTASSLSGIFNRGFLNYIVGMDWTNFNKLQHQDFEMFFYKYLGMNLDVANLDTTYATTMKQMFDSVSSSKFDGDLSHFKTGNVTTMQSMFNNFEGSKLDLSGWDTSKVIKMNGMFSGCKYLNTITGFNSWDTPSVTDMSSMFYQCTALKTIDLSNFDTSKVTNMTTMFYYGRAQTINFSNWNTDNVSSNNMMFYQCTALVDVSFGNNWMSHKNVISVEMHQSPLSKTSILDLANKIADKSDTSVYTGTYTVKLKTSQKSLFSEDELTSLANQFTSKNWTLAWS